MVDLAEIESASVKYFPIAPTRVSLGLLSRFRRRPQRVSAAGPIPGFHRPMAPGAPHTYPPFIPAGPVPGGGGSGGRRSGLLGQGEIRVFDRGIDGLGFGADGGGISVVVLFSPRRFYVANETSTARDFQVLSCRRNLYRPEGNITPGKENSPRFPRSRLFPIHSIAIGRRAVWSG